ncbi:hypothetical protein [Chryseobacterium sp. RR2-3-20]|uniref:hypothetical protein n=1 Tax=Chryseobacterium sp. RR2-3-20 TaxID=2787626 RepID=UPI001AE06C68|nr:hypothetical protein [Chryseobacterium sp. RR2-3-20]
MNITTLKEKIKKSRKNTQLESEGAEFLVLGNLMIKGISTYKTYQNFKGYDLVCVSPENNTSARIQVKSRFRTDWDGFIINDLGCDFVIFVALNRGFSKIKKNGDLGIREPDFYIFPIDYIKSKEKSNWGKITKSKIKDFTEYKDGWNTIINFLNKKTCT